MFGSVPPGCRSRRGCGAGIPYAPIPSLTVNPSGAYRVQGANGLETGTEKLLVATHLDAAEWTVEAAIPLAHVQLRGSRSRGELHLSLGSRRPLLPRAARCNCAGDWFCWSDLWTGATGWRKFSHCHPGLPMPCANEIVTDSLLAPQLMWGGVWTLSPQGCRADVVTVISVQVTNR
jgi:hypothetical protein